MEDTSSVIDTTGIELFIPEDTASVYVTTLEELVNTHGAIVQQETDDKASLLSVFQPTPETLRTRLFTWASMGFPASWKVFSTQITPPNKCSDGESREVCRYAIYLLDGQIDILLAKLNKQVSGITFSFFVSGNDTIGISVVKS